MLPLCRIDAISDGGARGFEVREGSETRAVFAVRRGDRVFVYRNSCPHTGVTLNWREDQFMSFDGMYIQCSMHFAQFRIADGYCVYGPCAGRSLRGEPIEIRDGVIRLKNYSTT
jgi:nitrite reductase/ring-hydroxylating ferredoxin subunit